MRGFLSVFLIILLITSSGAASRAAANAIPQQQEAVKPLTSTDVLTLVKTGLTAEIIITKLQRVGCDCDISVPELQRLKAEGVTDEILLAMISTAKVSSGERSVMTIPRGTVVEVETSYRINSQEIKAGDAISFKVVNPVRIGEHTVIAAGAIATGRVVQASRGKHFGRAGRLVWTMETVNAIDDSRVPIEATGRVVGDSKGAKVATRIAITGALLWPIAPVGLLHGFKRGENAYLPQGHRYEVTVTTDTKIRIHPRK